jgi:hypothetical protein
MAFIMQKAVLAVFGVWGLFAVSGANVNFWGNVEQPAQTAQPPWVDRAPSTTTTPVVTVARSTTTTLAVINNCGQVAALALAVGWPPDELQTLMSVVKAESRCQSWQHNVSDPNTGSYGLMQINGWWCLPSRYYPRGYLQQAGILSTCNDLFDPATNLKAGLTVLAESTWHAWATFDG